MNLLEEQDSGGASESQLGGVRVFADYVTQNVGSVVAKQ